MPAEPAAPKEQRPRRSKRIVTAAIAAGAVLVALVAAGSLVYLRTPTDGYVRAMTKVVPFPAAVVGTDVITIGEYLRERDALDAYFQSSAGETGTVPSEDEIEQNLMDTLVHKFAVNHLANAAGITVDEQRVDAFYAQAVGGADSDTFAQELDRMFGWTVDEFRDRVVRPVVLAMQLGEQIAQDESLQAPRRAQAQKAVDRLAAGEDFAIVAGETSSDSSAPVGGDVGYVRMSDVPPEWTDVVNGLEVGGNSDILDGSESFVILEVTDRTDAGDDAEVRLSIITVPKVTLEESVEDYLESVRVWRFLGRS